MKPTVIEHVLTPDLTGAREARALLAAHDLRPETRESLGLALSELATNLVRHPDPPPTSMTLEIRRSDRRVVCELAGDGGVFANFDAMWERARSGIHLAEGGMGLALVAAAFPDLVYRRDGERNRFSLSLEERPRILLVDDDPSALRIHALYLRDAFDVVTAASARESTEILSRQSFDLVICDIVMPGVSGFDLRAAMCREDRSAPLPFIFLSARTDRRSRAEAEGLAVDDYLTKPVDKDALLHAVRRTLTRADFVRRRVESRLDDAITRALHPSLPRTLGPWRCALRHRASEAGGGDLVFQAPAGDGHLVVLADLMGHGEGAKFFSHALAGYLHGFLSGSAATRPAEVLSRLNQAFSEQGLLSRTLATVVALHLGDKGRMRVASAGHPRPLLAGGVLDVGGPLPGLIPGVAFVEDTREFGPGERIVLHTDGWREDRGGDPQGIEIGGAPLEATADRLMADRESDDDDATLIVLEFTPRG